MTGSSTRRSPANYTAIDIDSSRNTVSRRLDDLRESFVVWPPYRENNLTPNLKAQEKVYFTDPVFTRLTPNPLQDLTRLSEQQLGMALLRGMARKEIEFVGRSFPDIAFEAKYVDGSWRGEVRTLQVSRWRGVVVTRSQLSFDDDEVVAVPAALLAFRVDT